MKELTSWASFENHTLTREICPYNLGQGCPNFQTSRQALRSVAQKHRLRTIQHLGSIPASDPSPPHEQHDSATSGAYAAQIVHLPPFNTGSLAPLLTSWPCVPHTYNADSPPPAFFICSMSSPDVSMAMHASQASWPPLLVYSLSTPASFHCAVPLPQRQGKEIEAEEGGRAQRTQLPRQEQWLGGGQWWLGRRPWAVC